MISRKIIGTGLCAILLMAANSAMAAGRNDPAAYRLISDQEEIVPPAPEMVENGYSQDLGYEQGSYGQESYGSGSYGGDGCSVGGSCDGDCYDQGCYGSRCGARWTATADAIIYDRVGAKTQTIFPSYYPGQRELNTDDFTFGFRAGPRLGLIRHGSCGYDLELMYFMIDSWSASQSRAITIGNFDVPTDLNLDSTWNSRLYNAELNVRCHPFCRVTLLAGFRWALLRETFDVHLSNTDPEYTFGVAYNLRTDNNLYGFQIGADAKLLQYGCFSVDGLVKAGLYNNRAEQRTSASFQNDGTSELSLNSAAIDHAAFMGEIGLQGCYQVTERLSLRAGYQVMWLDGVALAPSQWGISDTVDANNTVFYHGANAGLEFRF